MLGGRKGGSTAGKGGEKKTMEVDEEVDLNAVDDEVDLNYSARSSPIGHSLFESSKSCCWKERKTAWTIDVVYQFSDIPKQWGKSLTVNHGPSERDDCLCQGW